MQLLHYLFYLLKSLLYLLGQNLCIDLCGLDIGMSEHLRHYLDGDSATECYGGGEGVSAYMGGDMFAYVGFGPDKG